YVGRLGIFQQPAGPHRRRLALATAPGQLVALLPHLAGDEHRHGRFPFFVRRGRGARQRLAAPAEVGQAGRPQDQRPRPAPPAAPRAPPAAARAPAGVVAGEAFRKKVWSALASVAPCSASLWTARWAAGARLASGKWRR